MISLKEIKNNARQQLGNSIFSNYWLMLLLYYFIYAAIRGMASSIIVGGIIVAGPLGYGFARVCINRSRGHENVEIGDLFKGFTDNFVQTFLLGLLKGIFTFLWGLLLIVPGIIKSYAYSMSYFIMQADPTKEWKQCLDESQEMMKGHKGELFLLDLSFIGWYIVGALCCVIGVFFVYPYHYMARTNFYLSLKNNENQSENPAGSNDNGFENFEDNNSTESL